MFPVSEYFTGTKFGDPTAVPLASDGVKKKYYYPVNLVESIFKLSG